MVVVGLADWTDDGDRRAMAGPALDIEGSVEARRPFAHADKAEARPFARAAIRGVETGAVVGNGQFEFELTDVEADAGQGCAGMLDCVGDGFLGNSKEMMFDFGR